MRLIKILLLLQLIISLNSCGPLAYKKTDARKFPADPAKELKKIWKKVKDLNFLIGERKVSYYL